MPTTQDVKNWYERDLGRFASYGTHVEVRAEFTPDEPVAEHLLRIRIYTDTNFYSIVAKEKEPNGYLGCTSNSRKPRAGEDWHRGNDLADGPLTEETWRKILSDIVSYELVRVTQKPTLIPHRTPEVIAS